MERLSNGAVRTIVGIMARRAGFVEIIDCVVQMGEAIKVGPSAHGGGLGVVASRDLSAGEIILVEEAPLVSSQKSNREPLHMQLAKRVLQDDDCEALLEQMAVIYPRSLDEVEPAVLALARDEYQKSVQKLMQEQGESGREGARSLSEEEILGLVLKIAFSSFMGGVYVAGAMFNHSCRPNIMPQQRPNGEPGTCMVVTRAVASGEELTFSYLSPLEQSFSQRSKKFHFQHLSALSPSPWPAEMEAFSERLERELAAAATGAGSAAARQGGPDCEEDEEEPLTREEAEAHLCHMQDVLDSLDESEAAGEMDAKALLKELLAIKEEAEGLLHPRHLVLCRINNMIVRGAHRLLAARPHPQWALMMLNSTQELSATWNADLLGPDHLDLARIAGDRHLALDYLIANAPDALYKAFPSTLDTWHKASKAAHASLSEARRIARLYHLPESTTSTRQP